MFESWTNEKPFQDCVIREGIAGPSTPQTDLEAVF